jgi:hypothetical protein
VCLWALAALFGVVALFAPGFVVQARTLFVCACLLSLVVRSWSRPLWRRVARYRGIIADMEKVLATKP